MQVVSPSEREHPDQGGGYGHYNGTQPQERDGEFLVLAKLDTAKAHQQERGRGKRAYREPRGACAEKRGLGDLDRVAAQVLVHFRDDWHHPEVEGIRVEKQGQGHAENAQHEGNVIEIAYIKYKKRELFDLVPFCFLRFRMFQRFFSEFFQHFF